MQGSEPIGDGGVVSWPTVLILVFIAYGIASSPAPLESSRPLREPSRLASPRAAEDEPIVARLWQDPLVTASEAVEAAREDEKDGLERFVLRKGLDCDHPLRRSVDIGGDLEHLLVLPFFISGRQYV